MSNDYNGKKRSELPDSVFGIPQERKYPMPDKKHTRSAIKLFNHVDPKYEEQLAKAVIKNMKKYGIDGSVVGPNNRLRKYLPKDMIKESVTRPLIYTWERANIPEYSVIQESSIPEEIPNNIRELLRRLNSYDYGYIKNGKKIKGMKNFFEDYKSLTISEFEKYQIGVCWDYVHYEAYWFAKNHYKYETFYIQVQDEDNDCPSHTYLVFYLPNSSKVYYFESSWGKYQGIEAFDNIIKLHNTIKERHIESARSKCDPKTYFRNKYDAKSSRWEHLSCGDYMVKVSNGKVKVNESYIEESSHNKVYHLSQTNLDGKTIQPTVPSNYMTKNGYEDGKTKRVCFATSIDGCLRGLSQKCEGMKLFVHIPDGNYNIYKPSNKEVPDASITGEVWIKKAVKMKCIGQIYVIGDKGEDGIPYKYGDKTAELYDWEWKWIDKFNESVSILPQDTGISTVIFDIGDVLVSANIRDYLVADPEVPNEIVDELLKLWFIDKDEVDDTMYLDTYREIVNKRMGVEFSKYIPKLFQYNVDCVTAFDYTIPMIQDLKDKGYKVYYLSNWSAWTHNLLQEAGKFDFLELMDGGVFSYDAGYMKPNEEIYKILLNKYKINPEEAVFFDDTEENIEAANKLGIQGIHFPRHDASIVYRSLLVNEIYTLGINHSFLPDFIREYVYDENPIIEFNLGKRINEDKAGREIISRIRNKVLTSENYKKASKLDLSLKCTIENIDSNIVCVLILDGDQNNRDTMEAKNLLSKIRLDISLLISDIVSKISTGDGDEGCLYFTLDKRKIPKNKPDLLLQEYGTTGGTIVGANQPDSVYIVNYMQNNVFSGYKEPKQAICKKGMNQMYTTKNGKAVPVDIDKFKEEASDISVFRFKETPILSFDKIIENASVDEDFFLLLTGDFPEDRVGKTIEYDNRFVQEENFFDELDDITYCTESTIIGQIEAADYPYMKILTESMEGRCWNYYRDINGVFAMNELTGLRTPSYEDITNIPNSQIQLIERGTVYFGD